MKHENLPVVAVVLAADRRTPDPVAETAGVACKALAPVAGRAMILRVLDALRASDAIGEVVVCGPPASALAQCPELQARLDAGDVRRVENESSPSRSAEAAMARIDRDRAVLLTTADHALLRREIVDYFLREALHSGADAAFGLVDAGSVRQSFPGVRRTALKLRGGGLCSCNLFAFLSPRGRDLPSIWRAVEARRKQPWRLAAGLLGVDYTALYLLGCLTLDAALNRISKRLQVRLHPVMLPFPEAGVDVDTPADLALARAYYESEKWKVKSEK